MITLPDHEKCVPTLAFASVPRNRVTLVRALAKLRVFEYLFEVIVRACVTSRSLGRVLTHAVRIARGDDVSDRPRSPTKDSEMIAPSECLR